MTWIICMAVGLGLALPAYAPPGASAPLPLVAPAISREAAERAETRIILVRHGETEPDGTRDPALSAVGRERAERLALMLRDAGVTRILSTGYKRTQGTAAPLARATGLEVEAYEPAGMQALAETLRSATGVIVVVGHSNTTPEFVRFLGGDPGTAIPETEYDRLYVVVPAADASATVMLRY
jgi:phosphohistidine phosphatase SixA